MISPLLSSDLLLAQNVPPKAGTAPGVTTDSSSAPSGGGQAPGGALSGLITMAPILIVLVFLFVTMGRRQKKENEARAHLKKGDRVMTNAGLVGELVDMDERLARVKIAPGVTVQMVTNTVSPFVEPATAPAKDAKALAEKK